jgi:single-strand DNA-binding protein
MASVNKVILVGNLGRDPEVKLTPNGKRVASFSIATTERFSDQQGNRQEKTEWHNIVAWGKVAEIVQQYARKGSSIYVEGKLTTHSWDDQSGQKRYRTEVVANSIQLLGGLSGGADHAGSKPDYAAAKGYTAENSKPNYDGRQEPMGLDDGLPF